MINYLILGFMLFFSLTKACFAETISVVTEEAYPLQYKNDGKLTGPATEIIKQVLKKAQLDYTVKVLPWANAYHQALNQKNTLIFSIARTKQREHRFIWIGYLTSLHYHLYGLEHGPYDKKMSIGELKSARIGAIRNSATYQELITQNFTNIHTVIQGKQMIDMLQHKRIDLFPANKPSFNAYCQYYQNRCHTIKPLQELNIPETKLYFALSKQTPKHIVERIKLAYQQLLSEQAIAPITF